MTSGKLLLLSLPIAALVAGLALVFPSPVASWYIVVLHPGLLLLASALSLWVAPMYRGDMRRVFLFLSAFLLFYGLVFITSLVDVVADVLGGGFFRALLGYQVFTYSFLIAACVFVLRVVGLERMGRWGWATVLAGALLGSAIVLYHAPTFSNTFGSNVEQAVLFLAIRTFDVLVMVMLIPVLWLYALNARARYSESLTFTVIGAAVVASLVLAYVYEIARWTTLAEIVASEYQKGSGLDALYLFGYFLLVVGLFAHRMHHEWSLRRLDDRLA